MLDVNLALQTLIGLAVCLALLFLFLLGYTYWTRKKKEYWQRYEQKFRDYFFPLLLDYVEKQDEEQDPDDIIKKMSKRTKDYAFFITLLDDLTTILDGDQRDHLSDFIKHPVFLSYYTEKLFQTSKDYKIFACIYFQNTGNIDDRITDKLTSISKSRDLKIAYSATKALQSANDLTVQKNALLRFFKRDDITELMMAELLHLFDTGKIEDRPQVTKALKKILLKNIDLGPKTIIVRYMGNKNYYASSDFLYQFLKRIQYNQNKAPLIRALITALAQLQNVESASIIKSYISSKNIDTDTKIAVVKALSTLGGKENLEFLAKHLLKVEFPVRKAIIHELALRTEDRIELLGQFIIANLYFIKQFQHQAHPPRQLKNFVEKIENVAWGIKIALIHRLTDTHV
jgi:hypothetical protein